MPYPAPLFDRTRRDGRAFVPTTFDTAAARSGGPGRPSGRRVSALPWTAVSPAARSPILGTAAFLLLILAPEAQAQAPAEKPFDLNGAIGEAARRFELPERWIRAVMGVESAFRVRAVSPKGAMGLMQVMPGTYADLRGRYGLGADPYHPRDNVLAGAAYLREMYDRFGDAGFLAAYNAGPARYLQHVATGRPLPLETRAYVAKITPALGTAAGVALAIDGPALVQPAPRPSLFVPLGRDQRGVGKVSIAPAIGGGGPASGLFVTVSSGEGVR